MKIKLLCVIEDILNVFIVSFIIKNMISFLFEVNDENNNRFSSLLQRRE